MGMGTLTMMVMAVASGRHGPLLLLKGTPENTVSERELAEEAFPLYNAFRP